MPSAVPSPAPGAASPLVLVHGAWHGAWCWDDLAPLLRAAGPGRHVEAVDLPGHGVRAADPISACTPEAYAATVVDALERAAAAVGGAPAVLVGHSLGGMSVAAACEARPDLVRAAVYLCAYMPRDGESAQGLARLDPASALGPETCRLRKADGVLDLLGDAIAPALYDGCAPEVAARAVARLVPEPLAPMGAPARLTPERHGRVPRTYVLCTRDRMISPGAQRALAAAQGSQVVELAAGHSPMLECPAELAVLLAAL